MLYGAVKHGVLAVGYERQTSGPFTPQEVVHELAELAATKEIFKLTPDTARQRLSKLVKLEDGATPEFHQAAPDKQYLVGANPASGIQWIGLQFQENDSDKGKTYWNLPSAQFALSREEGDSDQLYKEVKTILAARLAKLGRLKTDTFDNGFSWRLGAHREVCIEKGAFDNPIKKRNQRVVMITMAIAEEEPN